MRAWRCVGGWREGRVGRRGLHASEERAQQCTAGGPPAMQGRRAPADRQMRSRRFLSTRSSLAPGLACTTLARYCCPQRHTCRQAAHTGHQQARAVARHWQEAGMRPRCRGAASRPSGSEPTSAALTHPPAACCSQRACHSWPAPPRWAARCAAPPACAPWPGWSNGGACSRRLCKTLLSCVRFAVAHAQCMACAAGLQTGRSGRPGLRSPPAPPPPHHAAAALPHG